ncbi:androgen-induced gene 1 protein-like isoform X1 [Dreissena polymorpha]|uniref:androgen-induced gene 1 protein-like isoform X1 n=1 Tax=Dreissena polymorpha TaxID=45954 RepID=UPI00226535B8|nr:androgen-induced gene 1 protein-like isoform X1 [Dreissena polymorpha]
MVGNGQLCVHAVCLASYVYTLYFSLRYIGEGDEPYVYLFSYRGFAGKFKYMTFLNVLLQTFYFGLSLLNDLTGSYVKPSDNGGRKSKLQSFLDVVLASLAYPIGVFVVMTFWAIYAVDRELVYPKVLDALIPQWLNHAMHTTVLPFLLIEQYVVFHDYPARSKGISILLAFGFAYLCWILWIAYYADLWVYPILQLMETHQRAIFFLVLLAFFITIYILGEVINKALWRKEYACKVQQKRKTKKIS